MSERQPVRRALVSVYDKTGIETLAKGLAAAGVQIVSTGSTAQRIADAGVPVTPVDEVTEFPECLDGRVKTLHPRIHAGILADRRLEAHRAQLEELGIEAFDLVVVNLYPFAATVASGAGQEASSNRSTLAARPWCALRPRTTPRSRWSWTLPAMTRRSTPCGRGFTLEQRRALAAAAFRHTADYDIHVASWMTNAVVPDPEGSLFPTWMAASYERIGTLRYGENPHQGAAVYGDPLVPGGLAHARNCTARR